MSDELGVAAEVPEVSATPETEVAAGDPGQQVADTGVTPDAPGQGKEVDGLRNEVIAKRRENREYKQALEAMRAELSELKGYLKPKDEQEFRDDDIITFGDYKRYEERKRAEETQKSFQQRFQESVQRVSANDDFEDRMALIDELVQADPKYRGIDRVFMQLPNGPELAYEFAATLQQQKQAEKKGQVSKKLDANLGKPPPVVGGSASPVLDETQRIAKMNPLGKEFDEMVRRVEGYSS